MRRRHPVRWLLKHPEVVVVFGLVVLAWASVHSLIVNQAEASYHQRFTQAQNLRTGCVRGMSDRAANMESWYAAYVARDAAAKRLHEGPNGVDARAAATYKATAKSLQKRVDAVHSLTWPDPLVPGALGPFLHPFGLGKFNCEQAYPLPGKPPLSVWTL